MNTVAMKGPFLPRIKASFFLLSKCTDYITSAVNIITFLPSPLPQENEKLLHSSNPVQYPEEEYLLASAILVNLTAPNDEFRKISSQCIWPQLSRRTTS